MPDRPLAPPPPALKGKPSTSRFSLSWQHPLDHGGSPITAYNVEVQRGGKGFELAYSGPELECDVKDLSPGTEYPVRLCALSNGGCSNWTSVVKFRTKPVEPGKCSPPFLAAKARANDIQLSWGK